MADWSLVERAVMAAEHAARIALIEHGIEPTGLVLNVTWSDAGDWAVGSKVPSPAPPFLAASLFESATEAGLNPSEVMT